MYVGGARSCPASRDSATPVAVVRELAAGVYGGACRSKTNIPPPLPVAPAKISFTELFVKVQVLIVASLAGARS